MKRLLNEICMFVLNFAFIIEGVGVLFLSISQLLFSEILQALQRSEPFAQ